MPRRNRDSECEFRRERIRPCCGQQSRAGTHAGDGDSPCVLVSGYQFYLVADSLADESFQRFGVGVFDYLADHVAFAADCSDNANLAGPNAAGAKTLALATVAIPFFAADKC